MGWGLVQCMPRKGEGKQGMVKGLPKYTSTFYISKITTQRGKGNTDIHKMSLVWVKRIMFKWLNSFHETKFKIYHVNEC